MTSLPDLFGRDLPSGFHYREDFVTDVDERGLLDALNHVAFADFEMHGVVARRRVAFFGESYDCAAARPMPEFLLPLRAKVAAWGGPRCGRVRDGAHQRVSGGCADWMASRRAQYAIVVGISLLSVCGMKFGHRSPASSAPKALRRSATHEITLARRSAYLMTGESRNKYEPYSAGCTVAVLGDVPNAP